MITVHTPDKTFHAPDLSTLEDQLMSAQAFGSYPAYWWDDDGMYWDSFDGRIWSGDGNAHLTLEDVADYAAWSLDIPAKQIDVAYTDDEERMTSLELQAAREHLGMSNATLGQALHVTDRTIRLWESASAPIPLGVRGEIDHLLAVTEDVENDLCDLLEDAEADAELVAYRTDSEFEATHPGTPWNARWWRQVCHRVQRRYRETRIVSPEAASERALTYIVTIE